jgi:hypothetical protein
VWVRGFGREGGEEENNKEKGKEGNLKTQYIQLKKCSAHM